MTPSPTDGPLSHDALWTFAVEAYARLGVAALCLRLQDEHGLDVDLLLACLWLAAHGIELGDAELERMSTAAAEPRARVLELRALRRTLGSDRDRDPRWQTTYEHLRAAELAAERVELECIEAALGLPTTPSPAAEPLALALTHLRRYATRCSAPSCEPLLRSLAEHVLYRPSPARE